MGYQSKSNERSNKKKAEQLGMSMGSAHNKLRKLILFTLLRQLGLDSCYRCGEDIEHQDHISMEHIKPWLDSDDPKGLYFDINNVTFSHLSCNSKHKGN